MTNYSQLFRRISTTYPQTRSLKRLHNGPRFRHSPARRVRGGAAPLSPEEDSLGTLNYALCFTKDYLEGICELLQEATSITESVRSRTAVEVKVLTTHTVFIENALRLIDRYRLILEEDRVNDVGKEELFRCCNELFRLVNENVAPFYFVKMSRTPKDRTRLLSSKKEHKYYEMLAGDDYQDVVRLVPGEKTPVPYYPPWSHRGHLLIRNMVQLPDRLKLPNCEGQLPLNQSGVLTLSNTTTQLQKDKKFTFSYEPTEACQPIPESITFGMNLF